MQKDFKPLCEATKNDAVNLIRQRFGESALSILDKFMAAPARSYNAPAGYIGYRDGNAVCLQAEMPRRLFMSAKECLGVVGGMTCKVLKGCPFSVLIETMDLAANIYPNHSIAFTNSCCRNATGINEAAEGIRGPESCTRYLWRAVRPLECAVYFARRKLLRMPVPSWSAFSTLGSADFQLDVGAYRVQRSLDISPVFFDVLMSEYLKTNNGLVCSRSAAEIEWIFGERMRNGTCTLLCAYKGTMPVGYLIISTNETARRWTIADLFALRNDEEILRALLSAVCTFLKRRTPAIMLETFGFPTWVQPLLKSYMPHIRRLNTNLFYWNSPDTDFKMKIMRIVDSRETWFFGPYDGDICM